MPGSALVLLLPRRDTFADDPYLIINPSASTSTSYDSVTPSATNTAQIAIGISLALTFLLAGLVLMFLTARRASLERARARVVASSSSATTTPVTGVADGAKAPEDLEPLPLYPGPPGTDMGEGTGSDGAAISSTEGQHGHTDGMEGQRASLEAQRAAERERVMRGAQTPPPAYRERRSEGVARGSMPLPLLPPSVYLREGMGGRPAVVVEEAL